RLLDKKVKKETWTEIEEWVKSKTKKTENIRAIGTGGNITKLYRLAGYRQKETYMPIGKLEAMYERICSLSLKDRITELRLNPDRADVIEHAAKIYLLIMKWGKVK